MEIILGCDERRRMQRQKRLAIVIILIKELEICIMIISTIILGDILNDKTKNLPCKMMELFGYIYFPTSFIHIWNMLIARKEYLNM